MARSDDYWARYNFYQKNGYYPRTEKQKRQPPLRKEQFPGYGNSGQFDNDGNPIDRPPTGGTKLPRKPKPKSPKGGAAVKVEQPTLF